MGGICEGRVVVVTGAGRGIGRAHALELARQGARVVVNDLGAGVDGRGRSSGPAGEVVESIRALGGEAVANGDDVADWDGAARLVETAVDAFGRLDVVVNNAGILRDAPFAEIAEDQWDALMRVLLKGSLAPARHAAAHWLAQARDGSGPDARIINTTSSAGLLGSVGESAYAAAKAGVAALTIVAAAELAPHGITVNAIAPAARTRMAAAAAARGREPEGLFGRGADDEPLDADPASVSPLVAWLASVESADVTGRVFEVQGDVLSVADGWRHGPRRSNGARWEAAEIGPAVRSLLAEAPPPAPVYGA